MNIKSLLARFPPAGRSRVPGLVNGDLSEDLGLHSGSYGVCKSAIKSGASVLKSTLKRAGGQRRDGVAFRHFHPQSGYATL